MATTGLECVILACGHGNRANPVVSRAKFDAHTHCYCHVEDLAICVPVPYIQSYTTNTHTTDMAKSSTYDSLRRGVSAFGRLLESFVYYVTRTVHRTSTPWGYVSSVRKRDCAWASPTQGKKDFL